MRAAVTLPGDWGCDPAPACVPGAAVCWRIAHAGSLRPLMATVLGLAGLVLFCTAVIALAAGVTYVVIRFGPGSSAERHPELKH